jgi:hypothetical protein
MWMAEQVALQMMRERMGEAERQAQASWGVPRTGASGRPVRRRLGLALIGLGRRLLGPTASGACRTSSSVLR